MRITTNSRSGSTSVEKTYVRGLGGVSINIAGATGVNIVSATGDTGSSVFLTSDFSPIPLIENFNVWINGVKAYRASGTLSTSVGTAYTIDSSGLLKSNTKFNQLEVKLKKQQ
jgi:hypothetical protein